MGSRRSRRLRTVTAAATVVLALAGCGGDAKLLPASDAGAMDEALQRVLDAVSGGDCPAANTALTDAQNAFAKLPGSVDASLRERIAQGLDQLTTTVPQQCAEGSVETAPTETTTATAPTETTPTETTTTTTTEITPTETTPTETTPTQPAPTTPDPGGISPDDRGGPDGQGPPGQQNKSTTP